mmetsp:Transcript_28085/g.71059  ORF Transcript_28085/g.71059 Transcript_28085/m.71059 type:complete len:207 (+) Transcript_28085:116-736(+)
MPCSPASASSIRGVLPELQSAVFDHSGSSAAKQSRPVGAQDVHRQEEDDEAHHKQAHPGTLLLRHLLQVQDGALQSGARQVERGHHAVDHVVGVLDLLADGICDLLQPAHLALQVVQGSIILLLQDLPGLRLTRYGGRGVSRRDALSAPAAEERGPLVCFVPLRHPALRRSGQAVRGSPSAVCAICRDQRANGHRKRVEHAPGART